MCDRCVIVLCLLDPDLGPEYLMYSCNPLEPWPHMLLTTQLNPQNFYLFRVGLPQRVYKRVTLSKMLFNKSQGKMELWILKKQKEKNISTKYMGILQNVQLNFNTPRGITSVMFWTYWGTVLLNFPVSFWWILAILKADCDAALDGTAKKCSSIIKLLTNCFQALFGTW